MNIIFIEQLCIITTIEVYPWKILQNLILDIEMGCDNNKAG